MSKNRRGQRESRSSLKREERWEKTGQDIRNYPYKLYRYNLRVKMIREKPRLGQNGTRSGVDDHDIILTTANHALKLLPVFLTPAPRATQSLPIGNKIQELNRDRFLNPEDKALLDGLEGPAGSLWIIAPPRQNTVA